MKKATNPGKVAGYFFSGKEVADNRSSVESPAQNDEETAIANVDDTSK